MIDRGFESINVIPFIDIMLVLLTIVLTTSTFIASGAIHVELPKASANATSGVDGLVIEVDEAGKIIFEQQTLDLVELEQHLRAYPLQTAVLIRADASLPLQGFVTIMDLLKRLGFDQLNLQTESP